MKDLDQTPDISKGFSNRSILSAPNSAKTVMWLRGIKSKICLFSGLIGVIGFISIVAFSRAYNGAHSYDQLLNGFVIGLLLAFIITSE